MDYRVLVLDLDGTTLNERGELEERDVAAAQALREAGVHVTIATGRLFTGSQWVARALGVQGAIAVMNGSELIDVESAELRHGHYIEPEHRAFVREVWASLGIESGVLFGSRRIHIGQRDAHQREYLETWTRDVTVHDDVFTSREWADAADVVAVATAGEPEAVAEAREVMHRELPEWLGSVTFRTWLGHTFLKLRDFREDKGTALHRLAEERGATVAQTVAVGDWHNDVPMLGVAGLSFAMAGGCEPAVERAHEVLDTRRAAGGAVAEVARRVWGVQV